MSAVADLLAELDDIGRDERGGWSRPGFGQAADELRRWFARTAVGIGLAVEPDANGNLWAWWGAPADDSVVTGSHLDSVPGGGRFDGPLGVVSALVAVQRLRLAGFRPTRSIAVVVLAEEEGSQFGVACFGSRLMTGALDPATTRLTIDGGVVDLDSALLVAKLDPRAAGCDDVALARIGRFVELHVEQGRGLVEHGAPVGLATGILAHGRWRITITGRGDHAGSTRMADRADPVVAAARVILEVEAARARVPGDPSDRRPCGGDPRRHERHRLPGRADARRARRGRATPSAPWSPASRRPARSRRRATAAGSRSSRAAGATRSSSTGHSASSSTRCSAACRRCRPAQATTPGSSPRTVPTAMLFVRNPTGVSHAPEEHADDEDVEAGVEALERILRTLAA